VSNAARVSRGSIVDHWAGLTVKDPKRDHGQHCTVTVQFYHTVSGGTPSPQDVMAAIDDMEALYESCTAFHGRLADEGANFMKSELTVPDIVDIANKVVSQPYVPPNPVMAAVPGGPTVEEVD